MRLNPFKRNQETPESSPASQRKTRGTRSSPNGCPSDTMGPSIFAGDRKGDREVHNMLVCQKDYISLGDEHGQHYPIPPPVCFSESFMVQPIGHYSTMKYHSRDIISEEEYKDANICDDDHNYHVPPAACFCKSFMVQPLVHRNNFEYHI